MSDKYKIQHNENAYFLTLTIVNWIDIFTRKNHKLLIIESLIYCRQNKGLRIFGWCLMSNHLHIIASADGNNSLSDILRDFKKYTSKNLINQMIEEPESRREWLLKSFADAGKPLKGIKNYKVWQDGNHAEEIYSNDFFLQKLKYIHDNPVKEMIVLNPEDYWFSSARNYANLESLFTIDLI